MLQISAASMVLVNAIRPFPTAVVAPLIDATKTIAATRTASERARRTTIREARALIVSLLFGQTIAATRARRIGVRPEPAVHGTTEARGSSTGDDPPERSAHAHGGDDGARGDARACLCDGLDADAESRTRPRSEPRGADRSRLGVVGRHLHGSHRRACTPLLLGRL